MSSGMFYFKFFFALKMLIIYSGTSISNGRRWDVHPKHKLTEPENLFFYMLILIKIMFFVKTVFTLKLGLVF